MFFHLFTENLFIFAFLWFLRLKINYCQNTCPAINPPRGGFTHGPEHDGSRTGCVGVTAGSECRFSCMPGCRNFTNPLPVLRCLDSAWSPSPPPNDFTCIPEDCPPQSIPNGSTCGPTPVGSVCTFSCNPGFQISGVTTFECLFNSQFTSQSGLVCDRVWQSGPLPVCTPMRCSPDLIPPNNGRLDNCQNPVLNQECQVICNPGYVANTPTIRCTSNGWSPSIVPSCEPTRCPPLTPTDNLNFVTPNECRNGWPGSRCEFSCPTGYALNPRYLIHLECNTYGQWSNSGRLPTCAPVHCNDVLDPLYGRKTGKCVNEAESPVVVGSVCTVICNEGCSLSDGRNYVQLECTDSSANGGWNQAVPDTCLSPSVCQSLSVPFTAGCPLSSIGQTCVVNCQSGYRMVSNNMFTCVRNTASVCSPPYWSPPPTTTVCTHVQCPDIRRANGQTEGICVNAGLDDVCTIKCSAGFQNPLTSGRQMTSKCQSDGQWDGPTQCRQITCPPLSPPLNGDYTSETCAPGRPGSYCTFSCNPNYRLNPPNLVNDFCREDGQWTNGGIVPTCVPTVKCKDIPNPINAKLSGHCASTAEVGPIKVGSSCIVECYDGCFLSNGSKNMRLTCSQLGTTTEWDPSVPESCQVQSLCPEIPPINFGNGCNSTSIDQNCTLTCDSGYHLVGNDVFTCIANTNPTPQTCSTPQWSPIDIPVCEPIKCPNINGMPDATLNGNCSEATVRQECTVLCTSNKNKTTIICQENGQWSAWPQCSNSSCPSLPIPANGQYTNETCAPGVVEQSCNFMCNEGFELNPAESSQIICQSDGTWNGTEPVCEAIHCSDMRNMIVENGGVTSDPSCAARTMGSVCSFFCNQGFSLNGTNSTECQANGTWSNEELPNCVIGCPTITTIESATYEGTCESAKPSDNCAVICPNNNRIELICGVNGQWDKEVSCPAKCQPLSPPENGQISGDCEQPVLNGQCVYTCNQGFNMLGESPLICTEEGWDKEPVQCQPVNCPALTAPQNGTISGPCNPGLPSQKCIFSCSNGFQLNGQSELTCSAEGEWNSRPPNCTQITCPDPSPPANVLTRGVCNPGRAGMKCNLSCRTTPSRVMSLTCKPDGQWSDSITNFDCGQTNVCPPLSLPNGARNVRHCAPGRVGQRCEMGCGKGFSMEGKSNMMCAPNGQWVGRQANCLRQCKQINDRNGRLSGQCSPTGLQNRFCQLRCQSGYRLVGPRISQCSSNGLWIPSIPRCLRQLSDCG